MHLIYYNIKMTKQIRKYKINIESEQLFNSNYLFVPIKNEYNELTHIKMFDVCSMKVEGVIKLDYL